MSRCVSLDSASLSRRSDVTPQFLQQYAKHFRLPKDWNPADLQEQRRQAAQLVAVLAELHAALKAEQLLRRSSSSSDEGEGAGTSRDGATAGGRRCYCCVQLRCIAVLHCCAATRITARCNFPAAVPRRPALHSCRRGGAAVCDVQ